MSSFDKTDKKKDEMTAVVSALFRCTLKMVDVTHTRAAVKNSYGIALGDVKLAPLLGKRNVLESVSAKQGCRLCLATRSALITAPEEFDDCVEFHAAWELHILSKAD